MSSKEKLLKLVDLAIQGRWVSKDYEKLFATDFKISKDGYWFVSNNQLYQIYYLINHKGDSGKSFIEAINRNCNIDFKRYSKEYHVLGIRLLEYFFTIFNYLL